MDQFECAPGKLQWKRTISKKKKYIQELIKYFPQLSHFKNSTKILFISIETTIKSFEKVGFETENVLNLYIEKLMETVVKVSRLMERELKLFLPSSLISTIKFMLHDRQLLPEVAMFIPSPTDQLPEFDFDDLAFPLPSLTNNQIKLHAIDHFCKIKPKGISKETIEIFADLVEKNYHVVFYHDFLHGFDVLRFFWRLINEKSIQKFFSKEDKYIASIAAFGHDLGHRGVNNSFNIKFRTSLSFLALGNGVLETYHSAKLLKIITRKANVLKCFSDPDIKMYKKRMVEMILATDNGLHHKLMTKLKDIDLQKSELSVEETELLNGYILHTADLSSTTLEFGLSLRWGIMINQEFQDQYLKEKELNFDPPVFMKYKNTESIFSSQIGFMNFFVKPLYKQLNEKVNGFHDVMKNLEENEKKYAMLKKAIEDPGSVKEEEIRRLSKLLRYPIKLDLKTLIQEVHIRLKIKSKRIEFQNQKTWGYNGDTGIGC